MIKNAKIIAEIGLGYGRCVDALLEKGYTGQIYAVERVEKFSAMASEKYDKNQVTVFSDDVINVKFPQNVDAILWMWSGIMELSAEEQELAICKLKASLNPNGVLFIEVPSGEIKIIGTRIDAQKFKVEAPWGTLEAHLPLEEDMKRVAQNCKYKSLNTLKYETEKGLKRIIYALIC
jgi:SAM-dependent methyltransferase